MAKYRQVHVEFWQDGFVLDLTPEEKYFFLYLMTNSKTTQCGIYELPKRIIETETGYNRETVDKLLNRFVEYEKIEYNEKTREVFLTNWLKYNKINSPKVISCIQKELEEVKHKPFVSRFVTLAKQYRYGIDTLCIDLGEEEEKEKEEEEEREVIPFVEIINYLNHAANKNYRSSTSKTKTLIRARWSEGFKLEDFKKVIDIKCAEWISDQNMNRFLRPETLFSPKFEGYLNQKTAVKSNKSNTNINWEDL